MGEPRNPAREIFWSLAAAVVFASGLCAYLLHATAPAEPARPLLTAAAPPVEARPLLGAENALVGRFAAALAAQDHAAAYALMAPAYRESFSLDAFRARCNRSKFLAGIERAVVLSARTTRIPGAPADPHTVQARGVVSGKAGSLEAGFTFHVTGEAYSLLVVELAGIPVLDGVSGPPTATP